MAAALRERGLKPGDRVGVLLPNVPEYLVGLFGTWMAGGVTVPHQPAHGRRGSGRPAAGDGLSVRRLPRPVPAAARRARGRPAGGGVRDHAWRTGSRGGTGCSTRLARLHRLGLLVPRRAGRGRSSLDDALAAAPPDVELARAYPDGPANILPDRRDDRARPRRSCSRTATCWRTPGRSPTGRAGRFGEDVILACLPFFHSYGLTTCGLTGGGDWGRRWSCTTGSGPDTSCG